MDWVDHAHTIPDSALPLEDRGEANLFHPW